MYHKLIYIICLCLIGTANAETAWPVIDKKYKNVVDLPITTDEVAAIFLNPAWAQNIAAKEVLGVQVIQLPDNVNVGNEENIKRIVYNLSLPVVGKITAVVDQRMYRTTNGITITWNVIQCPAITQAGARIDINGIKCTMKVDVQPNFIGNALVTKQFKDTVTNFMDRAYMNALYKAADKRKDIILEPLKTIEKY